MKRFFSILCICFILNNFFYGQSSSQDFMSPSFFESISFIQQDFIGQLSDLPDDFEPNNLEAFLPYLDENYDINEVYTNYETIINEINSYLSIPGNDESTFLNNFNIFDSNGGGVSALPECFAALYYGTALVYTAAAGCCAGSAGWGCAGCLAVAAASEQILLGQYNDCVQRNYGVSTVNN